MIMTGKRLALAAVTAAAVAGTAAGAAYAAGAATAIQPKAAYACEGSGHVVVTLLSTPSASCPAGTTSIVLGAQGPKGSTGAQGVQGIQGVKGDTGAPAPAPDFGIVKVNINRGTGPAAWATYSAPLLGSPAGDQAQGAFRFTCPASAPGNCALSLSGSATVTGWQVYPRVLLMKQVAGAGPEVYCEYGDGADNNGAKAALATTDTAVTLGIGGSLDCGAGQAYPASGTASTIEVPNDGGHYDVYTTLIFSKAA